MSELNKPWQPELDWTTPAGQTLRKLLSVLPADRHFTITLFGSAPIQLGVDRTLLSNDVDLFADADLSEFIATAKLRKEDTQLYVQECVEWNFRTSPKWKDRLAVTELGNCTIRVPHPIDILIAKLHRLEEKDMRAFRTVIANTGHPTDEEMKRELQDAVDLFRPGFDEEGARGDILTNSRILWRELFGRDIDVREEIIRPAIERRNKGMEYDLPKDDYKTRLQEAADLPYVPSAAS